MAYFLLFNLRAAIAILPSPRPQRRSAARPARGQGERAGGMFWSQPAAVLSAGNMARGGAMAWECEWMEIYDILMLVILAAATLFAPGKAWPGNLHRSPPWCSATWWRCAGANRSHIISASHSPWDRFLAMLVLYAVSSLIVWSLFRYVRTWIDRVQLKGFDHQLAPCWESPRSSVVCRHHVLRHHAFTHGSGIAFFTHAPATTLRSC